MIILGSFWNHFGIVFGQFLNIFIFKSFGNGPGAILGYSLIVFGYIRPIPSPFSGKIFKFLFFLYISLYIPIYIWINGWMDGLKDGWTERMDGLKDGWTKGWMDGKDGWTD